MDTKSGIRSKYKIIVNSSTSLKVVRNHQLVASLVAVVAIVTSCLGAILCTSGALLTVILQSIIGILLSLVVLFLTMCLTGVLIAAGCALLIGALLLHRQSILKLNFPGNLVTIESRRGFLFKKKTTKHLSQLDDVCLERQPEHKERFRLVLRFEDSSELLMDSTYEQMDCSVADHINAWLNSSRHRGKRSKTKIRPPRKRSLATVAVDYVGSAKEDSPIRMGANPEDIFGVVHVDDIELQGER